MEFTEEDRDYIALAASGESLVIVVLQVREGKLLGKEVFQVAEWAPDEEALAHFVGRYYGGEEDRARGGLRVHDPSRCRTRSPRSCAQIAGRQVIAEDAAEGKAHARSWPWPRRTRARRRPRPRGGPRRPLALEGLRRDLGLAAVPRRIEGFDIAHLEGEDTVASLVRFTDGRPDRKLYRAFTISSLDGKVDDFASIREAVARRYTRVVNEELEQPRPHPDRRRQGPALRGAGHPRQPRAGVDPRDRAWRRSRRRSSCPGGRSRSCSTRTRRACASWRPCATSRTGSPPRCTRRSGRASRGADAAGRGARDRREAQQEAHGGIRLGRGDPRATPEEIQKTRRACPGLLPPCSLPGSLNDIVDHQAQKKRVQVGPEGPEPLVETREALDDRLHVGGG